MMMREFDLEIAGEFLVMASTLMYIKSRELLPVDQQAPLEGVDANAFDPATQFAFSACGDGTTTIAHADAPDKLTVVQTLKTTRGARTMTIDLATHKIYLGAAEYETATADQRRPPAVAGSFKVLVFAPESGASSAK